MALISLGLMAGKALLGGGSSGRVARPQIQQTKISSSAFKPQRAATQKISKTTPIGGYGFGGGGGSLPKNAFLMPQVGASGGSLAETNSILIDIQSLLVADYNARIQKEQSELNAIRSNADKERRSAREGLLESGKKIGAATSGIFNKITAPLKGPLDGIFGFLSNVLVGFGMNVAFKWLRDNREKVDNAFGWLRDNFQGIKNTTLAVIGGALVLDIASKLYTVYGIVKSIFNLSKAPKPPTKSNTPGGTGASTQKQIGLKSSGRINTSYAKFIQGNANIGDRIRLYRSGLIGFRQLFSGNVRAIDTSISKQNLVRSIGQTGSIPKGMNPGSVFQKTPKVGGVRGGGGLTGLLLGMVASQFIPDLGINKFFDNRSAKVWYDKLLRMPPEQQVKEIKRLQSVYLRDQAYVNSFGGVPAFLEDLFMGIGFQRSRARTNLSGLPILFDMLGMDVPSLNAGGRLQSPDKRDRDSRLFYGTHDEMVINQKMSRRFPGVLDDINYNGGSLYLAMFRSLKEQKKNEDAFEKTTKKFEKLLDDIDLKQVRGTITPPPRPSTTPPPRPQLNSPPQNTSAGITPPSGREGSPGLQVLPPQVMGSTPPATPTPSSGKINNGPPNYEAEVPGLNPYINLVKMKYGLLGA